MVARSHFFLFEIFTPEPCVLPFTPSPEVSRLLTNIDSQATCYSIHHHLDSKLPVSNAHFIQQHQSHTAHPRRHCFRLISPGQLQILTMLSLPITLLTAAAGLASTILAAPPQSHTLGCYSEFDVVLDKGTFVFQSKGYCSNACGQDDAYPAMALTNGTTCLCGATAPEESFRVDDGLCNVPCPGYPRDMCESGAVPTPRHKRRHNPCVYAEVHVRLESRVLTGWLTASSILWPCAPSGW
jgi:hypothetical protein